MAIQRPFDAAARALDRPPSGGAPAGGRALSMITIGRQGRWGNVFFQYAMLRALARAQGFRAETPDWIGRRLFGLDDPPVGAKYPVVILDNVSRLMHEGIPLLPFDYLANRAQTIRTDSGRDAYYLGHPSLDGRPFPPCLDQADLEGSYIVHTSHLAPHQDFIRSLFQPVPPLAEHLARALARLRQRGRTVVGVHLRRGDFQDPGPTQGFMYLAPLAWYRAWLDRIWPHLERPVLLLCSDAPAQVRPHFARYDVVTAQELDADIPGALAATLGLADPASAAFYPDWFLLAQCDHLAVSNSTYSISAAMMSTRARQFVRPCLQTRSLIPFSPWACEPLELWPIERSLLRHVGNSLVLIRADGGLRALLRALGRLISFSYPVVLLFRAKACYRLRGLAGVLRELLRPAYYLAMQRRYDAAPTPEPTSVANRR
jgi:hypothetical protein